MIVLIIILIVLALILYLPVCLEVKYISGNFSYRVSYAFITFYPKKTKSKKIKNKGSKSKRKKLKDGSKVSSKGTFSEEKSVETSSDITLLDTNSTNEPSSIDSDTKSTTSNEKTTQKSDSSKISDNSKNSNIDADANFLEVINIILDIFKAIKINLGKFIKSLKITNLYVNFKIANQDAYDCALNFGKINIVVYNILAYLERNFKVKRKGINIEPKYNSNESVYDISFKVELGFGVGLGKILVMLFKVIPILKDNDII